MIENIFKVQNIEPCITERSHVNNGCIYFTVIIESTWVVSKRAIILKEFKLVNFHSKTSIRNTMWNGMKTLQLRDEHKVNNDILVFRHEPYSVRSGNIV